jgi:UTP:GlnB (protein PII) uridylyltransferase
VEVRALDHVGLLSSLAADVADLGLDVSAARLATVGDMAVDTFYLRKPEEGVDIAQVLESLLERWNGGPVLV